MRPISQKLTFFTILAAFCINSHAETKNIVLRVNSPELSKTYTFEQLSSFPQYSLKMNNSRAYMHIPMQYRSIRMCDVLKPFNVSKNDTIEMISTDQFSATMPAKFALACDKDSSIGYIAIEDPKHKWPALKYNNPDKDHPDLGTAGPLAVIWTDPEKSYVSNEYWAWNLAEIKIHHKLNPKDFLPAPKVSDSNIQNGYHAYISRCSACHTLNKIGKAQIGPDLNYPNNPTEYFKSTAILKKFIRNPQSVRSMPNDRMSGTNEKFLSKKDLDDLVKYFKYMAKHKI